MYHTCSEIAERLKKLRHRRSHRIKYTGTKNLWKAFLLFQKHPRVIWNMSSRQICYIFAIRNSSDFKRNEKILKNNKKWWKTISACKNEICIYRLLLKLLTETRSGINKQHKKYFYKKSLTKCIYIICIRFNLLHTQKNGICILLLNL